MVRLKNLLATLIKLNISKMELPKRSKIKTESPIEEMLYQELIRKGFFPIPQLKVGKYRIDLAFPNKMIAIECDGKEWHERYEQKEHDNKKDECLKSLGWRVYRITGSDIYEYSSSIAEIVGYREKPRIPMKIDLFEIDYENDTFEEIEYKEELNKQLFQEENEDIVENPFKTIKEILGMKTWK